MDTPPPTAPRNRGQLTSNSSGEGHDAMGSGRANAPPPPAPTPAAPIGRLNRLVRDAVNHSNAETIATLSTPSVILVRSVERVPMLP